MLKFVIGTAGTGKSAYITNQIISLAQQGEKCLLIVPEQFSKTGESILFSSLEDAQASLVSLYSFTSLMRDVQNNYRQLAGKVLDSAGKAVMARRAADRCKNRLQLYSRQANHFPFAYSLSGLFDDFKRSGISARELYRLVGRMPQKSPKLKELSRIYSEYCGIISDGFCDGEDLLLLLSQVLPGRYTKDTHIFVDGFESFSFGQLAVLKNMMSAGKSITFALTCDSLYDTTGGTLWQAKKTAAAGSLWLSYSGSRITSQGVSIPSRGSPSLPCSVRKMTDRRLFFPRTRWNIRRTSM